MKFKSIQSLLTDAAAVLRRFPLAMAWAAIATVVGLILMDLAISEKKVLWYLSNLGMVSVLGISLFLSIKVLIENHDWNEHKAWLLEGAGLLAMILYYFFLPRELKGVDGIRYGLLISAVHLLVAVAPFLFLPNRTNAFWQYNKALFLRIILAFIYSNTIVAGLSIALGVTDYLFEFIKLDHHIYTRLWLVVIGIFNTWFFLGGVPRGIKALEEDQEYPTGLRIFTQFVLIPLVLLYLVILYLYMGKIVMAWSLPDGWLSSFIIGVSTLGILTLLLVHPLTDKEEYAWFKNYKRYFYLTLFPLIVLMAIAIGRRVLDYGITEQRYFILLFTVWLFVVALRFTFQPKSNIRLIPLTLLILVLLASWGPWSAMSVSKANQMARLKSILTKNQLFSEGWVQKAAKPLSYDINDEVSSIVFYLQRNFGLQILKSWVNPSLNLNWNNLSAHDFVTKTLGLEFTGGYRHHKNYRNQRDSYFAFNSAQKTTFKVSGYDYYSTFFAYSLQNKQDTEFAKITVPEGIIILTYSSTEGAVYAGWNGRRILVANNLKSLIMSIKEKHGLNYMLPTESSTFSVQDGDLRFELSIQSISGQLKEKDKSPVISAMQGSVLFAVSKSQD